MSEKITPIVIAQIAEFGCSELAAKLQPETGIGAQFEPAASFNGFAHMPNPCASAVNALITGGLAGCGMEVARRTVDITFNAVGIKVSQAERDRFAFVLDAGFVAVDME